MTELILEKDVSYNTCLVHNENICFLKCKINYMMRGREMLKKFFKDESGQGMVEYALIIALIAIVVIAAVALVGNTIKDNFTGVSNSLKGNGTGGSGGGSVE